MDELPADMKPWLEHKRRADEPSALDQLRVARGLAAALGLPPESFSIDPRAPQPSAAGLGKLTHVGRGLAAWKVVAAIGALGVAGLWAGHAWLDAAARTQPAADASTLRTGAALAPAAPRPQAPAPADSTQQLAANHRALEHDVARANSTQPLAANGGTLAPPDEDSNGTRQRTLNTMRSNAPQRLAADLSARRRESPGTNATKTRGGAARATETASAPATAAVDGNNPEPPRGAGASAEPLPGTTANVPSPPAAPGTRLADDLRIIQAASHAVDAHDPAGALRTLASRPLRFLQEERDALRIVALCDLGQRAAAAVERASFERRAPQSPLRLRITAHCGPIPANP